MDLRHSQLAVSAASSYALEVFTKVVSCQIISSEVGIKLLACFKSSFGGAQCSRYRADSESLLEKGGSGLIVSRVKGAPIWTGVV